MLRHSDLGPVPYLWPPQFLDRGREERVVAVCSMIEVELFDTITVVSNTVALHLASSSQVSPRV